MPTITTLGELKKSGYRSKSVKEEMRDNLIQLIKSQQPIFPDIFGYERTVEKQIINAILSYHHFILLGLRGQGKTKIIRSLVNLLDDYTPTLEGTLLNENPLNPVSPMGKRLVEEQGDDIPIKWVHRKERFNEKLATPDVSIADLIGDIDPIKAAREKLDISNEEIIHWGIIPRSNRGIFAINELPDLQPRIQVGLFNILEEQDIQIRGFPLRLPLDVLLVFSANPEDYTNRGRIITPLKDRIDSQIITHYPTNTSIAKKITLSQIDKELLEQVDCDEIFYEIIEGLAVEARKSELIDAMSGVSQRLSISALENVLSNCIRRDLFYTNNSKKKNKVSLRMMDLYAAVSAITGKIELIEERSSEDVEKIASGLVTKAIMVSMGKILPKVHQEKPRSSRDEEDDDVHFSLLEYQTIISFFKDGNEIAISEEMNDQDILKELEKVPGLKNLVQNNLKKTPYLSFYMEATLEFLYGQSLIMRRVEKGMVTFLDPYGSMFKKI